MNNRMRMIILLQPGAGPGDAGDDDSRYSIVTSLSMTCYV